MSKSKTNEEFIQEMKIINPKIKIIGEYKNARTKVKCQCLNSDCGYVWETVARSLLQGSNCPQCAVKNKALKRSKSHKQFIKEMNEINPNIIILGQYINCHTKILCQCLKDGYKWSAIPSALLNGEGCPECANQSKRERYAKPHSQFVEEMTKVNPNIKILGNYINKRTKIQCKCLQCGYVWDVLPNNLLQGYGCPVCKKSKGEIKISQFLDKYKICYKIQYRFEDCRYKISLPFDFAIFQNNKIKFLIEYDGEQHYKPVCFAGISNEQAQINFQQCQIRDDIKNNYCREHNIKLLRIPYWEFDNIEKILRNNLIEYFDCEVLDFWKI